MGVLIGADFIPTSSNADWFNAGEVDKIIVGQQDNNLLEIIRAADYRIFNLEGPIFDGNRPIKKSGPALRIDGASINTYKALGVNLFTLANNHIMDHGVEGFNSTRNILDEAGILYVGAGNDISEASKPIFFRYANKRIGVFACAEHEFTIAGKNLPGANPIDYLETPDMIEAAKRLCDYLIILYHGGKEFYRYPSPELQRVCRKLVDKGADLILVQHTHCIGCEEKYKGATIVYGQGNFLFDLRDDDFWNSGLLVSLESDFSIKYYPVEKENHYIKLSDDKSIMDEFRIRSSEIEKEGFVEKKYHEFANNALISYYKTISIEETFVFRVINKLLLNKLRVWKYRGLPINKRLDILNAIRCEAHRELFIEGLKEE